MNQCMRQDYTFWKAYAGHICKYVCTYINPFKMQACNIHCFWGLIRIKHEFQFYEIGVEYLKIYHIYNSLVPEPEICPEIYFQGKHIHTYLDTYETTYL